MSAARFSTWSGTPALRSASSRPCCSTAPSTAPHRRGWPGDQLATLREALTNVARHAPASRVDVMLAVDDDNMAARAADRGASFAIRPAGASGTIVEWCVPVG